MTVYDIPTDSTLGSVMASPRPSDSLDLPALQPLSHHNPHLTASSFDADAFLLTRAHIPLEELRGELRQYLAVLREELVQLINDDYEQFISLGSGLRGEADRLAKLKTPLMRTREEVESIRQTLVEQQSALEGKLNERSSMREEKALLDLIQRLFDTLSRARGLLSHQDPEQSVNRVAEEYTQLIYLIGKAKLEQCKIAEAVSADIEEIRGSLRRDLSTILVDALRDQSPSQLRRCFKTYELIQGWSDARSVIAQEVEAICQEVVTLDALASTTSPLVPHTPHRSRNPFDRYHLAESGPLPALLNRLLERLGDFKLLMEIAQEFEQDILSTIIWPILGRFISERLGGVIFAAGRPGELHKHHVIVHDFVGLLEAMAPDGTVEALRRSTEYEEFERRWQLPVYFQLRWKELVGSFEVELRSTSSDTNGWLLPQSSATWRALEQCWDRNVYLPQLAPRFWRLSLQIIARYSSCLKETVDGTPADTEDLAQEDTVLRFAASAVSDVVVMLDRIGSLNSVESLAPHVSLSTAHFEERIFAIMVRRCTEPLKLVRAAASQLRSTSKDSPNTPSLFVPTVFKPLQALLEMTPSLQDHLGLPWISRVVEAVFGNYTNILASVKKTEDLLRRHRKGKKSAFSLFGGASTNDDGEEERFTAQMLVDVKALAEVAEKVGVNAEELTSYREIWEVLRHPG